MRIPLATQLKTRSGDTSKDARLKNAYAEMRGEQSVVRHRPSARGGVSIGTGTAQGGIGFSLGGTDYIYTFNGDVGALNTISIGTNWDIGTAYSIGDHVSYGFVDYWALTDHTGSTPPSSDWSTSYVPAVPFMGTYATWNPADKTSNATLSGGDLVALTNGTGGNLSAVRSTIDKSSGKWYWEVTVNWSAASSQNVYVGISSPTWNINSINLYSNYFRNQSNFNPSYGALCDHRGVEVANFTSDVISGDVLGIALDLDGGTLQVRINNGAFKSMNITSGTIGTLLTPVVFTNDSIDTTYTANFGASAFSYSVPSGYNSGLYTL